MKCPLLHFNVHFTRRARAAQKTAPFGVLVRHIGREENFGDWKRIYEPPRATHLKPRKTFVSFRI